jgi:hypothetical protein
MRSPVPPSLFLAMMLGITALALAAYRLFRARRRVLIRRLAAQWQMHYAEADHFNIAGRIAADFPVPGAANLRVLDLIYASDARQYCYIFTAEYTRGVIERQTRESRVMGFCESKDHPQTRAPLILAPPRIPVIEQYRKLKADWPPAAA